MHAALDLALQSQRYLQAQCHALAGRAGEPGSSRLPGSLTADFQGALAQHRADLLADLLPALLEAMAGSDAVCIREMGAGVDAQLRAIEAAWRGVCGAWQASPDAAVRARELLQHCDRLSALENDEILPMAARLLDDATLEQAAQAMRERRAVP